MLFRIWLTLQLLNHHFQCQMKATIDVLISLCHLLRASPILNKENALQLTYIQLKWPLFSININSNRLVVEKQVYWV